MNKIVQRQNVEQSKDKLKAQRHTYTIAKWYGDVNFICCIVVVLVFALLKLIFPQGERLVKSVVFYGTIITIAKIFIARKLYGFMKEAAHTLQMFDCYLFDFPRNRVLCGKRLEPEDICEVLAWTTEEGLVYSNNTKVGNLTHTSITLGCMRINVTYVRKI